MAQDGDMCDGRLIGNRIWPIYWYNYQWPWVTLNVTFTVWNLGKCCIVYYKVKHEMGKRTWLVISTLFSKMKNFLRSQAVICTLDVVPVISWRPAAWWLVPATADSDECGSGPSVSSPRRQPPFLVFPLTPPSCGRCDDCGRWSQCSTNGMAAAWQRSPATSDRAIW